ncbi:hypothetical protein K505DRAFT_339845 [Melanomma pulvis-pyrius CBS 109.77]|uniref:Uncharacterized protein n=1 Tax=Melanomma pulvis-pyrius CBS 109.77 TaxID=1314802 RepID=A0A6A6X409_9PLEO|nr:hypothetical protein K505DRAFT_339845 [Melanomma pulvis-pyrius CBS 109.77]
MGRECRSPDGPRLGLRKRRASSAQHQRRNDGASPHRHRRGHPARSSKEHGWQQRPSANARRRGPASCGVVEQRAPLLLVPLPPGTRSRARVEPWERPNVSPPALSAAASGRAARAAVAAPRVVRMQWMPTACPNRLAHSHQYSHTRRRGPATLHGRQHG